MRCFSFSDFTIKLQFLALIVTAAINSTRADDWPTFGGDRNHNAVRSAIKPPMNWQVEIRERDGKVVQESRNIVWNAALGTTTFGDPIAVNGLLWVGTNNVSLQDNTREDASVLACFRAADGKELYRYVSPRLPGGRSFDWPMSALNCSPLSEGDRLWFTTNRGEVVCLDTSSLQRGEGPPGEVWKVDMMKQFGVRQRSPSMGLCHLCSITSYQDFIYVITGNGIDEKWEKVEVPEAPSVICFNKQTGEVVWKDNSPGANILVGQWSSPLVIEIAHRAQVVVPQGDGWLRSFDARSGDLIWKFDINFKATKFSLHGRSSRNDIVATPVFYEGHIYVAHGQTPEDGEGPGRLVCIDPTKSGDISSELGVDADGQPVPANRLQAVDPEKGQRVVPNPNSGLVWQYLQADQNDDGKHAFEGQFHRTVANVAIKDNLLIVPDFSGLVHCLDAHTGKVHWTYDCMAGIYASPLIVGDKVYIADEDGEVAIFGLSADPKEAMRLAAAGKSPLAEMSMDNSIYCSPIFANDTLYIATRTRLYAIRESDSDPSGNWPQWRGPNRDNISTDSGLLQSWPIGGPPLEWRTNGIGQGIASVAAASKDRSKAKNKQPDAIFVPTPDDVVAKMLEVAAVQKSDLVYDLGSGDGRIVIAAAKRHGSKAVGVELDKELFQHSLDKVQKSGVESLVQIKHGDLFEQDLSHADVVALYLPPNLMDRLLPQLKKLKPGARVVSHFFKFTDIPAQKSVRFESQDDGDSHEIYLWTAPLRKADAKP